MDVYEALRSRGSTRAFLDRPVPRAALVRMLDAARWAPSGNNTQPWRVHVVAGATRQALCDEVRVAAADGAHDYPYPYYPAVWRDPFLARRRDCGWGLYSHIGIVRGDRAASAAHTLRNFDFFGAPVGLFFFVHDDLRNGGWLDNGMFMQSLALAARREGLHTCLQAAWAPFHEIVRRHVGVGPESTLACGMAIGYADPDARINGFRPHREPVEAFASFHGI